MVELKSLVVSPFQMNCYILIDPATRKTAVIDPGDELPRINSVLERSGAQVELILLTHGHIDHIGAAAALKKQTGAPVLIHPGDLAMLSDPLLCGAAMFDLPFEPVEADRKILEGDRIQLGEIDIEVLETPGHSPGGVSFLLQDRVITGDCLFREGLGRVDLPGGDMEQIICSIKRLAELDESLLVYPGHGPSSTIAHEKKHNPVLLGWIS